MGPWWGIRFCNTSLRHWDWLCPPLSLPLPMSLSLSLTAWESGTQVYGPVWWWPHLTDCFTASQPLPPTLIPPCQSKDASSCKTNVPTPPHLLGDSTFQSFPHKQCSSSPMLILSTLLESLFVTFSPFFFTLCFASIVGIFLFQMLTFALFCTIACYF